MSDVKWFHLIWQSAFILLLLGIPVAVFANSISDTLSSSRPDWTYVIASVLLIISAILIRLMVTLIRSINRLQRRLDDVASIPHPSGLEMCHESAKLIDVIRQAKREVLFIGVAGKRSIADDGIRRFLEQNGHRQLKIRILLLDPESKSFSARAREEKESVKAWKSDYASTIQRVKDYNKQLKCAISVRHTAEFPIWRLMVADGSNVWLNTFLMERRGTESTQWKTSYPSSEIAYGLIRGAEALWERSDEVAL
jgi:hypothetical protein